MNRARRLRQRKREHVWQARFLRYHATVRRLTVDRRSALVSEVAERILASFNAGMQSFAGSIQNVRVQLDAALRTMNVTYELTAPVHDSILINIEQDTR